MKRIRRGWALTKKSWALLNSHRELVRFPLYGGIAIVTGAAFLYVVHRLLHLSHGANPDGPDASGPDAGGKLATMRLFHLSILYLTLLFAGVFGVLLGLLAGHFGGWVDNVLMRIADVQLAFPAILLAILLASVLGPSLWNVIVVISITNWVVFARVTRSQVLTLRSREYVEAARRLRASRSSG